MSKYLHTFGQYRDGYQWIDFCRLCGAEGQQLWSDCPGQHKDVTEHRRMARFLNLAPDNPETWPLDILNKLIELEKSRGSKELFLEIDKLNGLTNFY